MGRRPSLNERIQWNRCIIFMPFNSLPVFWNGSKNHTHIRAASFHHILRSHTHNFSVFDSFAVISVFAINWRCFFICDFSFHSTIFFIKKTHSFIPFESKSKDFYRRFSVLLVKLNNRPRFDVK